MEAFQNGTNESDFAEKCESNTEDIRTRTMIARSATRPWVEGDPFMRIVEQPHPTLYRFRYKSEGRLAGSIPGINSVDNKKTFPSIEILNYTGSMDVLVSCVTVDEPYLQHPHKLVGKKNSKNGVYCIHLKGPPMQAALNNVGIRCVRKDDIEKSLKDRKEYINFDPFGGGYNKNPNVNLSAVRLCFQGFIPIGPKKYRKLQPVISEPITDKKHVFELVINRLCSYSDKSSGGTQILMFCSPLLNSDVQIRFYEERQDSVWEAFAKFEKTDVHLKCGIAFRTPPYRDVNIEEPVEVLLQLVRYSTETSTSTSAQKPAISQLSQPIPFTYCPDPDRHKRSRLDGQMEKMFNWVRTANNTEYVADTQIYDQALDTAAPAASANSQLNSTVEPLLDSENQMSYQWQQMLQIWHPEELPMSGTTSHQSQNRQHLTAQQTQPLEHSQMNQQAYQHQFDPHPQQVQTPIMHSHQPQFQPMQQQLDQYQTFHGVALEIQQQRYCQIQQPPLQMEQSDTTLQTHHIHSEQLPQMLASQYQNNGYN